MKTWLHRISHCYELSLPLLDKGYLSIGFSDFLVDEAFFLDMTSPDYDGDKTVRLKEEAARQWGQGDHRTIHNLKRFLSEFTPGDRVLVPSWGTFSVYQIVGNVMRVCDLPQEVLHGLVPLGGQNKSVSLHEDGFFTHSQWPDGFDLGFLWPVKPIHADPEKRAIPRDWTDPALTSRMKIRQTNCDISALSDSVDKVIKYFEENRSPSLHVEAMSSLAERFCQLIQRELNGPDHFEKLIKWYFFKIGADTVVIPPKNQPKENPEADVDVEASFEAIKVRIHVQGKFHREETDDWAVTQIRAHAEGVRRRKCDTIDDYIDIFWVISTCTTFSNLALDEAIASSVRLIDGKAFAQMLLDAGLNKLDVAFER
jgi:hypothetical protein